jgi:hypothetical protein
VLSVVFGVAVVITLDAVFLNICTNQFSVIVGDSFAE